ncbi:HPP family protein [Shewanella colwelliana]|uniref:CBS domain-containing protein n=1 Tax=Shewanella colwelliana TaxID=23 RepID=A0A1E5IPV9_SHECO|nr:CBS domain-containing protein [Shewanella colwelliana]MCZ4336004.1 CBS domain-containing protein [Shewanella colwelliana]MDX1279720.1 CBS domain-containing protein [Shewanella colwelliana]OEG72591.1 CBS domain-containing protein [Shewanella colwelliana]GIU21090.1 CBS domain-containing protein [Shewanella colwelliana]GIU45564.1 CBS domain-containing protein [Shewanella colwelliana]
MKVSDIMSHEVVCISDQATAKDAHLLMQDRGVRHLPVISETDGKLVGIITHKKMISAVIHMLNQYGAGALDRKERKTTITELMETDFQKLTMDEPLAVVVDYFIDNKLGCLPVVDEHFKVKGIVTSSDFVKLCAKLLQAN